MLIRRAIRRSLLAHPFSSMVAVGSLAVAVAIAAIGLRLSVALRQDGPPNPAHLRELWAVTAATCSPRCIIGMSALEVAQLRTVVGDLGVIGVQRAEQGSVTAGDRSARVSGAAVSQEWFWLLQTPLRSGRAWSAGEVRVAVLATSLAEDLFGDFRKAIGRSIRINGELYIVIGTIPDRAGVPDDAQYWVPLDLSSVGTEASNLAGVVRVKSADGAMMLGLRLEQTRRAKGEAGAGAPRSAFVDLPFGSTQATDPALVLAALFIVLTSAVFLATLNVGGLLLKRTLDRLPEFALCAALGARSSQLLVPLIVEAAVLAAASGGLALPLIVAFRHEAARAFSVGLHQPVIVPLDPMTGLLTLLVVLLVTVLVSALPILSLTGRDLRGIIQGGGPAMSPARERMRAARYLLGVQTMIAVLFTGASVGVGDVFYRASHVSLGYDSRRFVWTSFVVPADDLWPEVRGQQLVAAFEDSLRALARDRHAAVWDIVSLRPAPQLPSGAYSFEIDGRGAIGTLETLPAAALAVNADFFTAFGYRLETGRIFGASDQAGSEPVAVVNRAAARRMFGSGYPLGRRLRLTNRDSWMTVVGIVDDRLVSSQSIIWALQGVTEQPMLYRPLAQVIPKSVIGASVPAEPMGRAVQRLDASLRALMPGVYWKGPYRMSDRLTRDGALQSLQAHVAVLLAVGTLVGLLALIGTYAMVGESIRIGTQDIQVRRALGAPRLHLIRRVLQPILTVVMAGSILGATVLVLLRLPLSTYICAGAVVRMVPVLGSVVLFAALLIAIAMPETLRATRLDVATYR